MNKPIRIAQIVGKVVISGVDSVVMNYYRHIDRSRIQFDFFMDGYEKTPLDDEIISMGGRVFKLEPYEQSMVKNIRQCHDLFKENKYAIVHSHLNTLSVFPLAAAAMAKIPVRIAHNHSTTAKGEFKRNIMKNSLRPFSRLFANQYAACGEHAGEWLFGKNNLKKGRIKLIRNAVDISDFQFKPEIRRSMRLELGLDDKFIVGHVGRFVYPKNHHFLIDIFSKIKEKAPDTVLLLVGSGELQEEIIEKVRSNNLEKDVIFLGLRRDVPNLLQAMDVFCLPSHYEGFPVVGVEAQATGLPCIMSTSVPGESGITELAQFIPLSNSVDQWADHILSLKNADQRHNYSGKIQETGFEINSAAESLCSWYESLLKDKI